MDLPRFETLLYVPAHRDDLVEAAIGSRATGVIIDLEDSVPTDHKESARSVIGNRVDALRNSSVKVIVRVNGLDEGGRADLMNLGKMAIQAVLVPKIEGPEDVAAAVKAMEAAGTEAALWLMVESPSAVLDARGLVAISARTKGLVLGYGDLAKCLGAAFLPDEDPLRTAGTLCLLAGRSAGVRVYDGVTLGDGARFAASCEASARAGFDGKTVVSVGQAAQCAGSDVGTDQRAGLRYSVPPSSTVPSPDP